MRMSPLALLWVLTVLPAFAAGIFPAGAAAQSASPSAAVASVGVEGELPPTQRLILYNQLQARLSGHYRLVPQEALEDAEQRAFEELKFHECVLEPCLRKLREFLQIERLFFLQVARAGELTQLTLTVIRPDDKIVRAYNCQACEFADLHSRVASLAAAAIDADLLGKPPARTSRLTVRVVPAGAVVEIDGEPRGTGPEVAVDLAPGVYSVRVSDPGGALAAQQREVQILSNEQKDVFFFLETTEAFAARQNVQERHDAWKSRWRWSLGLGIAAGLYSWWEADAVGKSNHEQQKILADMEGTTSWNEYVALQSRLQSEEDAAKSHKTNSDLGLLVSAALLGTAAWVYFDPPPEPGAVALLPSVHAATGTVGMTLVMRW